MINFYISAFLADLAIGAVLLSLPLLLICKFNATSLMLGFFGALGAFIYSSSVLAAGRLSDRFNRRILLILGCIVFILVYSILPVLRSLNQVFFVYIFGSASMSMFWPIIQSWLSQGLNKEKLVKSLTNFNIYWSAGLMLGFLFAGVLFTLDPKAPFIFGALLIAVVIFLLFKQPVSSEIMDEQAQRAFLETEKDRPESAGKFLYIGWCANFVSWYIVGTVRNLFPKLGIELGFSNIIIGFFIFLLILAQTTMFFILGRTNKWHYRLSPIVLFQMLAIVALLIITFFSTTAYFMIAMVFLGLCSGITYFSSIFYSLYGFIDKGRKSGIHEAFLGAGTFFGPLIGGFVAHKFDIRAPYITAAMLVAVAIAVELIVANKSPRHRYNIA
jgi:MFS family permease